MEVAIAVLTRDLRIRDNAVLVAATREARRVVPLFVLDDAIGARVTPESHRYGFLCECLEDLDVSLRARGASLVVREGDWVAEVMRVVHETGTETVHVARDVSGYAHRRLGRLRTAAERARVRVVEHDSLSVLAPDALGHTYQVFTPYHRRWLATPWRQPERVPARFELPSGVGSAPLPRGCPPRPWHGGETAGRARLGAWTRRQLGTYSRDRDRPGVDATARISPYLHFGCLSPLEVARRVRERADGDAWLRQLCWREFFMQLLWSRPDLGYNDLRSGGGRDWVNDEEEIRAWQEGRTGFPLVDAGMRQLRSEGWMHNRVRMVAASFLTKDLAVDWRIGAAHFSALLVDGDVAVNQLSWQWVAGTGTGANPHRVLNPQVQAHRHDPDGTYTTRWIDEFGTAAYPAPIVDHHEAIAAWRARGARGHGVEPP